MEIYDNVQFEESQKGNKRELLDAQRRVREDLDQQVARKKAGRRVSVDLDKEFAAWSDADLENWVVEYKEKKKALTAKVMAIKGERDAQVADQERRRNLAEAEKVAYETKLLQLCHEDLVRVEKRQLASKKQALVEAAAVRADNEANSRAREAKKLWEHDEEVRLMETNMRIEDEKEAKRAAIKAEILRRQKQFFKECKDFNDANMGVAEKEELRVEAEAEAKNEMDTATAEAKTKARLQQRVELQQAIMGQAQDKRDREEEERTADLKMLDTYNEECDAALRAEKAKVAKRRADAIQHQLDVRRQMKETQMKNQRAGGQRRKGCKAGGGGGNRQGSSTFLTVDGATPRPHSSMRSRTRERLSGSPASRSGSLADIGGSDWNSGSSPFGSTGFGVTDMDAREHEMNRRKLDTSMNNKHVVAALIKRAQKRNETNNGSRSRGLASFGRE